MRHFHNLLYVSHGTSDETEGLKQALSLARNNSAPLCVLIVAPEFPEDFPEYKRKYEESLVAQVAASIKETTAALNLNDLLIKIRIELATGDTPDLRIIQHVIRHQHDLVIKEAEQVDKKTGFKALDMALLRKCPTPVWLCRPITQSRQHIQVAVAIDPEGQGKPADDLSKRMLELSRSLSDSCSGELHIVSCWDYIFEDYLKRNVWFQVPDAGVRHAVNCAQRDHRLALDNLIVSSGIEGEYKIYHLRGKADEQIPRFVEGRKIDVLVMGTLGRTGIPGFLIGNTAENIVQRIGCSLMALKPPSFVSPVKPA